MAIRLKSKYLLNIGTFAVLFMQPLTFGQGTVQFDDGRFLQGTGIRSVLGTAISSGGVLAACGSTSATDFSTPGVAFETLNVDPGSLGIGDAYVALYNAETLELQAATYLGGTGFDECRSVSFGPNDEVVVVGSTRSDDFPVSNGFDSTLTGNIDGFVASFNFDLSVLNFATYVGGSEFFSNEVLTGVTVTSNGNIHAVGINGGADLPITELFENRTCASDDVLYNTDTLYLRLAADGTLNDLYCLGGNTGRSGGYDIVTGNNEKVYLAGRTDASDFTYPTTPTDLAASSTNGRHLFVLQIDGSTGDVERSALIIARLDAFPFVTELAVNSSGELVVVGGSNAPGFVPTANALKSELVESEFSEPEFPDYISAGYIMRLSENLDSIEYASYIGGDVSDQFVDSVAVKSNGDLWLSIKANTRELPVQNSVITNLSPLSSEIQLPVETSGARDFKIALQPGNSNFSNGVLAQPDQNYGAGYPDQQTLFLQPSPVGPATGDTRSIALQPGDVTGRGVMANYDGVNIAFNNGFSLGSLTFGDSSEKSTRVAIRDERIYVVNDGQPNTIYSWSFSNSITPIGTFGNATDNIVDIDYDDAKGVLVAALAPNTISTFAALDGQPLESVSLAGFLINEMRNQAFENASITLVSNENGPSELVIRNPGDSLSDAFRVVVDSNLPGIRSMIIGYESAGIVLLAATGDKIHMYSLDPSNNWAATKIHETPTTVTDPRFGENWYGTFEDVVPVANANGPATYHHISPTDLYLASLDTVSGQQLSGTYLGGAGRDDCDCAIETTASDDLILAANTYANELTGVSGSDSGIGRKAALIRVVENTDTTDTDADGVLDILDNCTNVANPDQVDTDSDGYGNACDGDFDNSCSINFVDIAAFSNEFLSSSALFDLNNDGAVNFVDFSILTGSFLQTPGPGLGECASAR